MRHNEDPFFLIKIFFLIFKKIPLLQEVFPALPLPSGSYTVLPALTL